MGNSGLRKMSKKDPIRAAAMQSLPELQGAVFVFGRIASGKTTALMSFAQAYHDHPNRKYKVFDIWGGDRNEHLYWTLPSNKINYWTKVKKTMRLNKVGPKQYKVNLLYPLTSKLPKKLPNNDFVHSKVFTIPFSDVLPEDLALVTGALSNRDEALWGDILHSHKKKNIPEIIWEVEKRKGTTYNVYRNSIAPLCRELLLQKSDFNMNLDIKSELDDQQVISVLCLDFVEREYKLFIAGYILRKINEALDKKRRKVVLPFREASEIFRVTDMSIVPDRVKVFKSYLSQWIRMSRRGSHLLLDTQSPSETRGILSGQQDLTLLGRLPSSADRSSATDQLMSDNLISKKQVNQIGILEPGQFIVCPSGKHAYFQYFFLPKSRFWEEGNGNFYRTVWKNTVDKWIDIKSEIDGIKAQRKIEELEVKEKKKKSLENKEEFLAEKATLADLEKDLEEIKESKNPAAAITPKIDADKIAKKAVVAKPIILKKKPVKILSKKAYKLANVDKFNDDDVV